jgi:ubiquinone/menaquinone biosynthesis C-methylase UbiE
VDTILCSDNAEKLVDATIREVSRVLKPGGLFFMVSYGMAKTRRKYFDRINGLSMVDIVIIQKPGVDASHFVYVVKLAD